MAGYCWLWFGYWCDLWLWDGVLGRVAPLPAAVEGGERVLAGQLEVVVHVLQPTTCRTSSQEGVKGHALQGVL